MNKEQFWQIIDDSRKKNGDLERMYNHLVYTLCQLEVPQIIRWKQVFDEYMALSYKEKLWAAASIMQNGCSDDGFDYFRAWLIMQGKDVFLKALYEPDTLANNDTTKAIAREMNLLHYTPMKGYRNNARFEGIMYAASEAYERKTKPNNFYDKLNKTQIPKKIKAEIMDEVKYAADIDVKWHDWDASNSDECELLKNLLPQLHKTFRERSSGTSATYLVRITQTLEGYVEIDANGEEEAISIAQKTFTTQKEPLPDMENACELQFNIVNTWR